MFGLINKIFIGLLTSVFNTSSIVNVSNHAKCVYLNN